MFRLLLPMLCLWALTACSEQQPGSASDTPSFETFLPSPHEEVQAVRDAQAVRERFQGDGQSRYTSQPVDRF